MNSLGITPLRWSCRRSPLIAVLCAVLLQFGCGGEGLETTIPEPLVLDDFGGDTALRFEASGRFRMAERGGKWWFVTPQGHAFFSHGIQGVSSSGTGDRHGKLPYRENILKRHGSVDAWLTHTLQLLRGAGQNTVGDFSEQALFRGRFPYVTGIHVTPLAPEIAGAPRGFRGAARDFFDPAFEQRVNEHAGQLADCAADPYCIGAFFDDEYSFTASFMQPIPQFDAYQFLGAGAPGKRALQAFLQRRYSDIGAFNEVWNTRFSSFTDIQQIRVSRPDPGRPGYYEGALGGSFDLGSGMAATGVELASFIRPGFDSFASWRTASPAQQADRAAFRGLVAERYHAVADRALEAVSPDLLNLCGRLLATTVTAEVVRAAAEHCDVLSINAFDFPSRTVTGLGPISGIYDLWASWTGAWVPNPDEVAPENFLFWDVRKMQALIDKPILLSSFSYRAKVKGMNDFPPTTVFEILPSQRDRADRYASYMERAATLPAVVGAHWFIYSDQPPEGRADGENSNFGVVDIRDEPYTELLQRMALVTRQVHARKRGEE